MRHTVSFSRPEPGCRPLPQRVQRLFISLRTALSFPTSVAFVLHKDRCLMISLSFKWLHFKRAEHSVFALRVLTAIARPVDLYLFHLAFSSVCLSLSLYSFHFEQVFGRGCLRGCLCACVICVYDVNSSLSVGESIQILFSSRHTLCSFRRKPCLSVLPSCFLLLHLSIALDLRPFLSLFASPWGHLLAASRPKLSVSPFFLFSPLFPDTLSRSLPPCSRHVTSTTNHTYHTRRSAALKTEYGEREKTDRKKENRIRVRR